LEEVNLLDWNSKTEVKKGNLGEAMVRDIFESNGWHIYPHASEGPHIIDMVMMRGARENSMDLMLLDVKTKAHRTYYSDTGLNLHHYYLYSKFSNEHNSNFYLAFVDESEKKVYGNYKSELEKPRCIEKNGRTLKYPLIQNEIIYFPYPDAFEMLGDLTPGFCKQLKKLSQRNYEYPEYKATSGTNAKISTNGAGVVE